MASHFVARLSLRGRVSSLRMVELATHSVATVANERERERGVQCTHTHSVMISLSITYVLFPWKDLISSEIFILYLQYVVVLRLIARKQTVASKRMPVRCLSHLLLSNSNRIEYRFRCHLSCRIVIITFLYSQYPHIPLTFGKCLEPAYAIIRWAATGTVCIMMDIHITYERSMLCKQRSCDS